MCFEGVLHLFYTLLIDKGLQGLLELILMIDYTQRETIAVLKFDQTVLQFDGG